MKYNAFYGYDGNGDRAYKLTGVTSIDQYNAGQETFHMHFNDAVLYVNPYFVVTPKGYTKHYYNGSQRIAAQIGQLENLPNDIIDTSAVATERIANACAYIQSLLSSDIELQPDTTATFVDIDGDMYDELQWQCTEENLAWNIEMQCDSNILLPILSKDTSHLDNRVSGIYYYHPDHLGSAAWVTHGAQAVQFVHYMPFGEMWYNQQGSAYNERYKFTGKERDAETGYDYFGARYYASGNLSWLSVDPLADKYPNISPYAYCNWNPIKFVDPDGREKNVFLHPLMDETLRKGANNYKDNVPSIHIWAHGSSNSIQFYNEATDETIMVNSVEKVLNFLNKFVFPESDAWQKHLTEGTQAVIVLHACETGKGENSIAQQLSAQLPNTIVIAPNENVAVDKTTNKELGTYKTRTVTNEKGENVLTIDGVGAWIIFREGNPIVSFDGSTKPNASKPENFHIGL